MGVKMLLCITYIKKSRQNVLFSVLMECLGFKIPSSASHVAVDFSLTETAATFSAVENYGMLVLQFNSVQLLQEIVLKNQGLFSRSQF